MCKIYDKFQLTQLHYLSTDDETIEVGEITQNNGHYAAQGHSRSPILYQSKPHNATSY